MGYLPAHGTATKTTAHSVCASDPLALPPPRTPQAEAAKRTEAGRLAAELQRQVLEKRERDAHLSKLYTYPPASGYFAQFGTSHR